MNWHYTPYALLLVIDVLIALGLLRYAWQRRGTPGAYSFVVLMCFISIWGTAYALELVAVAPATKLVWAKTQYVGIVAVPLVWLLFAMQVSGIAPPRVRRWLTLLVIVPLATLLLVWTNDWHGLVWSQVQGDPQAAFPALSLSYGPWFWVHSLYSYGLLLCGTALLIRASLRSPRLYRQQIGALLFGAVFPWFGNAVYLLGLSPIPQLDLTPFAFTITGAAFAWSLFRFRLLNVVPVARDAVIAGMRDGVLVLNVQQQIVDYNPVARAIFGGHLIDHLGHAIDRLLPDQARLISATATNGDHHSTVSRQIDGEYRDYQLVISALQNAKGQVVGYLLVFHDTTDRSRAEHALRASEARYRAVSELTTDFTYSLGVRADGKLDLEWVTDAFFAVTGFTGAEVQARGGWLTLIHPDDVLLAQEFARSIGSGHATVTEFRVVTKDGAVRWLRTHSKPEWDHTEGRVVRVLGASRDITARKNADAALRASEARQRALLNAIPDMMFRINRQGVYLDFHAESSADLAVDPAEIVGKTTGQLLPPAIAQRVNTGIERALATGDVQVLEYQLPNHNGLRDYEARFSVSGSDEALVIVRDITDRKQTEQALRQKNDYLDALHATTLEIMNRLQVSDVLEAIVLRAGALVGTQHGYIYLVDTSKDPPEDLVVEVGVGTFRSHIGYRIKRGTGIAGTVWATGAPLAVADYGSWSVRIDDPVWSDLQAVVGVPLTSGGQVIGVIGLASLEQGRSFGPDQIEILSRFAQLASIALDNARLYTTVQQELIVRKQAEIDLALARDQALEVARLKSEFLALMGHELRTPLNAIIGFTDLTLEQQVGPLNEMQQSNLSRVSRNARSLLALINSILDMSKIDAGHMQLATDQVVIDDVVMLALSNVETLVSTKQLQVRIQRPAQALPTWSGDGDRLHQVLLNLVSNAVKFTPPHGAVWVSLEHGRPITFANAVQPSVGALPGEWIAISVGDTGIGIAPEEHDRIWSEFYQIDGSATRQYDGTGLGLAIVKRLVLLMEGHIALRSALGCGSTFTIWLPAHPSTPQTNDMLPEAAPSIMYETHSDA